MLQADTVTLRETDVVALKAPDVPVIVIVDVPAVALPLAVSARTLLPVVGFLPNAAVTPLGKPETDSATLPLNPASSITEIVSVALPF
jgi:hypothetical protein